MKKLLANFRNTQEWIQDNLCPTAPGRRGTLSVTYGVVSPKSFRLEAVPEFLLKMFRIIFSFRDVGNVANLKNMIIWSISTVWWEYLLLNMNWFSKKSFLRRKWSKRSPIKPAGNWTVAKFYLVQQLYSWQIRLCKRIYNLMFLPNYFVQDCLKFWKQKQRL